MKSDFKKKHSAIDPIPVSIHGHRYIRLLSDMNLLQDDTVQGNFAEKFGELIGLHGSITLSTIHEELQTVESDTADAGDDITPEVIINTFLQKRKDLVHNIALSFSPNPGRIRDKLPGPKVLYSHFQMTGVFARQLKGVHRIHSAAFEPYRKFYSTRQKNLETRVQHLRSYVNSAISNISNDLAQLAKLDTAFDNVLSTCTRDFFNVTPNLLEKRFNSLFGENQKHLSEEPETSELEQWMKPDGWISLFCKEMCELLLAELDVRLLPVLGMIDALPKSDNAHNVNIEGEGQDCD